MDLISDMKSDQKLIFSTVTTRHMTSCDLKNITSLTRIHLKEKIEKGKLGRFAIGYVDCTEISICMLSQLHIIV